MYDVLSGIRVVDMSSWTFVPAASAILADWGADVIKIEHPVTGDPQRGLTNALTQGAPINPMMEVPNRGKRSIGLDVSKAAGRNVLQHLLGHADVFLTNLLPKVRRKLLIDAADVRLHNPNIIYALGSAQGSVGPEAGRGGFDLASAWARSGVAFQMTPAGGEPPNQPGSLGDLTGGVALAGAIAAALFKRERTGTADTVEVSLYGIGMWWMAQAITASGVGIQTEFRRRENPFNPLVNYFPTQDERWVCLVMLQADRWWPDLCVHLDRPDLIADPRFCTSEARSTNVAECTKVLDEVFRERSLSDWQERLATVEGVWAPVLSADEVREDPQARANGLLPLVDTCNDSSYRGVASPARFANREVGSLRRAPEHAEHTEEILLELNFTWDDIADLKALGAVS